MTVHLNRDQLRVMHRHAAETYPNECVGLFLGVDHGEKRQVSIIQPLQNNYPGDQANRFEVDPMDYLKAERFAERESMTVLGVYHSHPNHPANPSQRDLEYASFHYSYIIISVQGGQIGRTQCWRLNEAGHFEEQTLQVDGS